jgi:hypothetical protein
MTSQPNNQKLRPDQAMSTWVKLKLAFLHPFGYSCTQDTLLGSNMKPCNCNWDYAYADGSPVLAEGLDTMIFRISAKNGKCPFFGEELCWMNV